MKIKQQLIITDPLEFAKGNYLSCFTLSGMTTGIDEWINCGEIELDIDIDAKQVIQSSLDAIERKEQAVKDQAAAALEALRAEKSTLLAIGHDG
ncbi:MAG: hypothetical protein HRU12_08775 [Phaeodactylibacter sp.]|nr:hypothetical protein [Phaeodactylibacter sp.]